MKASPEKPVNYDEENEALNYNRMKGISCKQTPQLTEDLVLTY